MSWGRLAEISSSLVLLAVAFGRAGYTYSSLMIFIFPHFSFSVFWSMYHPTKYPLFPSCTVPEKWYFFGFIWNGLSSGFSLGSEGEGGSRGEGKGEG